MYPKRYEPVLGNLCKDVTMFRYEDGRGSSHQFVVGCSSTQLNDENTALPHDYRPKPDIVSVEWRVVLAREKKTYRGLAELDPIVSSLK